MQLKLKQKQRPKKALQKTKESQMNIKQEKSNSRGEVCSKKREKTTMQRSGKLHIDGNHSRPEVKKFMVLGFVLCLGNANAVK